MGYDLMQELAAKTAQLDTSVKMLRKTGSDYAEAERAYKVLLAREAVRLRDEGMAVGMIDKVIYGLKEVSDARFKRDIAEVTYKANHESINSLKLQMRLIESQIDREWGQAK